MQLRHHLMSFNRTSKRLNAVQLMLMFLRPTVSDKIVETMLFWKIGSEIRVEAAL